jgi:uncharacterized membrane protein
MEFNLVWKTSTSGEKFKKGVFSPFTVLGMFDILIEFHSPLGGFIASPHNPLFSSRYFFNLAINLARPNGHGDANIGFGDSQFNTH